MNLEEAKKKYSIEIPSDEIFYSREYIEYFASGRTDDKLLEKYRDFQEIYRKSFLATFGETTKNDISYVNRNAVILGGQTGAGKTGLVNLSMRDALLNGKGFYLIDDDQYRKFYPRYDEIMAECPEYSTILTAIGSGPVTPKIMKYASDHGFNFIFDGTMKNGKILNTADSWVDYEVICRVMATSRIESLLSIFERNAYLRSHGFGRPISVAAHDETYAGVENTVRLAEEQGRNIEVYMRGNGKLEMPKLIYSRKTPGIYQSAYEALLRGREIDQRRCLSETDVFDRIANLEVSGISANPIEKGQLEELKETLRQALSRVD